MARGTIPKKNGERWLPIENAPEYYVSNLGRVRKNNRLIKCSQDRYGYLGCWIIINEERKRVNVHRLVAQAFIPNPENKRVVDHIDGCKTNNEKSNLRWLTDQENTKAAYDNGLIKRSEVVAIDPYDYVFLYKTQVEASEKTKVDKKTINQIIKGERISSKGWRFFRMRGFKDERGD